jgi:CO dehydrogenase/acetyl-CoA synthase beta subunit
MKIFNPSIDELHVLADQLATQRTSQQTLYKPEKSWPRGSSGEIILGSDTALELGHPQTESVVFLLWTDDLNKIRNQRTTLIGPELNEIVESKAPYCKIIFIGGHGFSEENAYERWQQLDTLRLSLNLKGQMLRAIPQQNREWSRISKSAMESGLSFSTIGNELIRDYLELDYVDAVELLQITSSVADIEPFKAIGENVQQLTAAMNRIFDNLELDCDACDFSEVCEEIEGLKEMHARALGKGI